MTDADLSRRLCELMEPEPPIPDDLEGEFECYLANEEGSSSELRWWRLTFDYSNHEMPSWQPAPIDYNTMARVREELRRRGLHRKFSEVVLQRIGSSMLFDLIDAPLSVQIAAAVGVLESAE